MRFHVEGTTWTYQGSRLDEEYYKTYTFGNRESYQFHTFVDKDGNTCTYDGWKATSMWTYLIYDPGNGWEVGDYFEIKRTGLDPDLRGRLVEIDAEADRWPYKIAGPEGSQPIAFGCKELTKIHSVTSFERAPKARAVLVKKIEEARAELEALETALEILDYAS